MKDEDTVNEKRQKRNDFLLIVILILVAAVLGGGYYWTHRTPALWAEIRVDGKLAETLDLSKNQEVTIHGAGEGVNLLIVQEGEIWCEEASCPDQVCVHQGKQSRDGEMIVCLPNRMVVQVKGEGH